MATLWKVWTDDESLTKDLDDKDALRLLEWSAEIFAEVRQDDSEKVKKVGRIIRRIAKVSAFPTLYNDERLAKMRARVVEDIEFVLEKKVDLDELASSFTPLQNLANTIQNITLD